MGVKHRIIRAAAQACPRRRKRPARRVYALAVHDVGKALGIPDWLRATEEQVGHCQWHPGFTPALEAYLDKFLLGKSEANTDVLRSKYTDVDRARWIPWTTPALK